MSNLLEASGARLEKPSPFTSLFTNRFFLGLYTNRNPLRSPTGVIQENWYRIGSTDAMIDGQNVELSVRLTPIRRPGNTAGLTGILSGANFPDIANTFYSFHEIGGTVRVFVDGANSVYLWQANAITPIFTKSAGSGQSYFQGIGQSLYFGDGKDQQKWLDFGAGNPGNSFATITNTSLTSNVATITSANNFAVGQTVVISGTTNGSGVFNGTFSVIAPLHPNQFSFNLTNSDIASAADTGFASGSWNWQPSAPTVAPTISIVASGSAAVAWVASTVFTTMGLLVDGNGNAQQLISVNASGTNSTQLGTTGNGEPVWNQTPGATTTDNTVTWTNFGPIVPWKANTVYNNASVGGTAANPCCVWDSVTGAIFLNIAPSDKQGTSGGARPKFVAVSGAGIHDGTARWICVFPVFTKWTANHVYGVYPINKPGVTGQQYQNSAVVEPVALPAAGGTFPTNQTIYLQISGGGTSGAASTPPLFASVAGQQTTDKDLIWLALGSATWAGNKNYTAWSGVQPVFSAIKDTNSNMQVCTTSGTSGATQPLAQWVANHAYSLNAVIVDSNGNKQTATTGGTSGTAKTLSNTALAAGVATYTSNAHGFAVAQAVTVTGSTNANDATGTFNVTNQPIISVTANTFTVNIAHDNIAGAADIGTAYAGPTWNTSVAGTTADGTGTLVWTTGSNAVEWGTKYGDATKDGSVIWVCVGPPMSWVTNTQWYIPAAGFLPPSSTQPYGGATVVGNSNTTVQAVVISGKSAGGGPTFSATLNNFVIDGAATWRDVAPFSQNSITWTRGYGYAYAFKARATSDLYAPLPSGGGLNLGQPAGTNPNPPNGGTAPTGSADGSVSTASPNAQMVVGPNVGAVVNLSGQGSIDPQVDTISIFRTLDGGQTFFWLTDIANPQPVGGVPQTWKFQDFVPDNPTATFPGTLNFLVLAPLAHAGDPPLTGLIDLSQHLGRIFGSVGATVYCSEGPLVGGANQPPGNAYTSFNPGQYWTFSSPVSRLVPAPIGLLVFTTSDVGLISGGSGITSQLPSILVPGLGLTSYNALANNGGLIYLVTADGQGISLDPSLGVSEVGFPIGDKIALLSPASVYTAYHIQGTQDKALFLADGSTGWYRCNPNQVPDYAISGPVWSPKAKITGGIKAIASLEVSPGKHALVMGATIANQPLLVRDSTFTTFTDNGSTYQADYTFGSMVLAHPGQQAEIAFITCEYQKVGTSPKLLVLFDEISDPGGLFQDLSGFVYPATGLPPQDSPWIYGTTGQSATLYKPRYWFAQSIEGQQPKTTMCRHLQVKVSYDQDSVMNELLSMSLFGKYLQEQ